MIVIDGFFITVICAAPHVFRQLPRGPVVRVSCGPIDWKSLDDNNRVDGTPSCGESALQVATGWQFHHPKCYLKRQDTWHSHHGHKKVG